MVMMGGGVNRSRGRRTWAARDSGLYIAGSLRDSPKTVGTTGEDGSMSGRLWSPPQASRQVEGAPRMTPDRSAGRILHWGGRASGVPAS